MLCLINTFENIDLFCIKKFAYFKGLITNGKQFTDFVLIINILPE